MPENAHPPAAAPAIRGRSLEEFFERVRAFHGRVAPGVAMGGFMVELAWRAIPVGALCDAIAETRACLPDAIQLLTPCTVGNGWLRVIDTGRLALVVYDKHSGEGVRVALDPARLAEWPMLRDWAMKRTPKSERDEDRILKDIVAAGFSLYRVEPARVDRSRLTKKDRIFVCPDCGESFRGVAPGRCGYCSGEFPFYAKP